MERAWLFDTLSVTMAEVDFHDPELRDDPDARERGVRVEIRPATSEMLGTVYVSPDHHLAPRHLPDRPAGVPPWRGRPNALASRHAFR